METSVRIWLWLIGAVCIRMILTPTNALLVEDLSRMARHFSPDPLYTRANSTAWVNRDNRNPTTTTPSYDLNKSIPKNQTKETVIRRGKVKFFSKISTASTLPQRRKVYHNFETTTARNHEKKTPSEMIDSMRDYKTKLSSPLPMFSSDPSKVEELTEEENDSNEDDEEDNEFDISKYVSEDFHDVSNVFTLPSFFEPDAKYEGSEKVLKKIEFDNFKMNTEDEFGSFPTKSNKFRRVEEKTTLHAPYFGPLTTPRHDFFDRRFKDISQSILNNLAVHKTDNNRKSVYGQSITDNIKLRDSIKSKPNIPKLYYHNRKQILLTDKEHQGSGQKELSDVEGTSIYYEMSMLSTDNYDSALTTEVDCENETLPYDTTASTSTSSRKTTSRKPYITPTLPTFVSTQPTRHIQSTKSYRIRPLSALHIPKSTTRKVYVTSTRQNLFETTFKPRYIAPMTTPEINSRRIQYTPAKSVNKLRMSPRKNSSYAVKVNKNEIPVESQIKQFFTTLPTDIDPIYHGETDGSNKIVDSKILSDNNLPSLRKRGSMRFKPSSTLPTPVVENHEDTIMAIPPTSSAWALAGMRNPPSAYNFVATTSETHGKLVESNQVFKQIVTPNESKKEQTLLTTAASLDFSTNKIEDEDENKLPWKPIVSTSSTHRQELSSEPNDENMQIVFASPVSSYPTGLEYVQTPMSAPMTTTKESKREITTYAYISSEESSTVNEWVPVENMTNDMNSVFPSQNSRESISKFPENFTTPYSHEEQTKLATNQPDTGDQSTTTTMTYEDGSNSFMASENETPLTGSTSVTHDTEMQFSTIKNEVHSTQVSEITTTEKEIEFSTELVNDETTQEPAIETTTYSWVLANNKDSNGQILTTEVIPITTYRPYYMTTEEFKENTTEYLVPSESAKTPSTTTTEEIVTKVNVIQEYTSSRQEPTLIRQETTSIRQETTSSHQDPTTFRQETTSNRQQPTPIRQETTSSRQETTSTRRETTTSTTTTEKETTPVVTEDDSKEINEITSMELNKTSERITDSTRSVDISTVSTTQRNVNDPEDLMTNFSVDPTSDKNNLDPASAGAAVAIAVSTIGVIALVLLIALLFVLRRRNIRGVYAQRCTPVSLDAYSLDSVSVGRKKKGASRFRASKRSYGNPAYDDEVVISHPMQYQALASFALDHDSMANEFTEIPSTIVKADEIPPGCEDKNRYSNIVPLPETRVPLRRLNDDPRSEYINANYVPGPGGIKNYYIACQAPMTNTVTDFWRMIWEQNSRVIVMLTEYMENGVEKCYEYLPPNEVSDNKRRFGDFEVVLKHKDQRDKYAVSTIQLKNHLTKSYREIFHLWYFWPAKGVPEDFDSVIDFLLEMRSYMKISQNGREFDEDGLEHIDGESNENTSPIHRADDVNDVNVYSPRKAEERMTNGASNGTLSRMKAAEKDGCKVRPMTVICASGCGRTGAMIVLELCARALETSGTVDLPRAVRSVRETRPHALPNRQHYIFVYKVLSEYGNKLMGGSVDSI